MNAVMDLEPNAVQQPSANDLSQDDLSDLDVDGEGSSSLSEIEDKDAEQDEDGDLSDDSGNNDSEAETERLEESPDKFRKQQDVVLSAHNGSQTYERTPSKLQHQIGGGDEEREEQEEDGDDEDLLSDDDISVAESPNGSNHEEAELEPLTVATSLEDSSVDGKKKNLSIMGVDTRKRKRSIMAGSGLDTDFDEPIRKRNNNGSIMGPEHDYEIDDENMPDEEHDPSNLMSGNITDDDLADVDVAEDEVPEDIEVPVVAEEEVLDTAEATLSPKKRGRKKKKVVENGVDDHEDETEKLHEADASLGDDEARNGDEDNAEIEGDDGVEAALKNEEELEKKRIALDRLGAIEQNFSTFRDRLYDERLEQLHREEAMLRQDKPTHPDYLAMIQCIDDRRDEKLRIADRLREYELETLRKSAVGTRAQVLCQFNQEAREIREKKLEELGQQWYEIQHDRRSYAGSVPEYTLKFPTRRSQQVANQVAYSSEVSILSGIAKYVGFPAAPAMTEATSSQLEDDLAKMGRTKRPPPRPAANHPLQELAALRSAIATSRFRPAEEQFIEQTPWANPQHPAHAHLLQRQMSAQHAPRTTSPFSQVHGQIRRHSHQAGLGLPVAGTFPSSSSLLPPTNGQSSHNPFTNSTHPHTIAPSPLASRQTSSSPQQSHPRQALPDQQQPQTGTRDSLPIKKAYSPSIIATASDLPHEFLHEALREQAAAVPDRS